MPAFLERKLKARYGQDSDIPYKIMNSIGAMRGNKETAKGRSMQAKHDAKKKPRGKRPKRPSIAQHIGEQMMRMGR